MSQAKGLICQKHCGTAFSPTWKTKVIVDQVTVAQYLGDPGPTARTNHHPKLRWSLSYRICQISITTTWSSFLVQNSLFPAATAAAAADLVPPQKYLLQSTKVNMCANFYECVLNLLWSWALCERSWICALQVEQLYANQVFKILKNWKKTFHLFELKILYYVAIIWSTHDS